MSDEMFRDMAFDGAVHENRAFVQISEAAFNFLRYCAASAELYVHGTGAWCRLVGGRDREKTQM